MALKNKSGSVLQQSATGFTHATTGAVYTSNCDNATDMLTDYYTNNSTANRPNNQTGSFVVWAHKVNTNAIVQYATLKAGDAPMWMRHFNGTWGDWVMLTRPGDIYPVGSIYRSAVNTNPTSLFGGTWTLIGSEETITVNRAVDYSTNTHTIGIVTLDQLADMFEEEYGYVTDFTRTFTYDKSVDGTITSVTESYYDIGISMYNHAWNLANIVITGWIINNDNTIYAYVNNPGEVHITAVFSTHRPMYQWQRTA